jgi:hypothetical protein
LGKPKKGGYPPPQPTVNYIKIQSGEIDNATIAWGDSVVWTNLDKASYTLALQTVNGQPPPTQVIWAQLTAVGTEGANSAEMVFQWTADLGKDPVVYVYGMLPPGTAKARVTAQIKV